MLKRLQRLFQPRELLIIALALAVALNLAATFRFLTSPLLNDLGVFYVSGQAWVKGLDLYWPDLPLWQQHARTPGLAPLNLNPPLVSAAFVPLSFLPLEAAGLVWLALNIGAFLWVWRLVVRETGADSCTALVLMAASGASVTAITAGQLVWLLAVPMTFAWRAARHGDWNGAALWLGACAYVKPFVGIFVLQFLLRRRFGAATRFALAFAGVAVLSLLVAGVPAHWSWLRALNSVTWQSTFFNMSVFGLFARLQTSGQLAHVLWVGVSLALAAVTLARLRDRQVDADREFVGLLLLALLVLPIGWVYYLVLVAGPLLAMLPSLVGRRLAFASFGLFCPPLTVSQQPGFVTSVTIDSIYLWSGLSLWVMTVATISSVDTQNRPLMDT
jgi:alpha-1,2-mannosyltransferase